MDKFKVIISDNSNILTTRANLLNLITLHISESLLNYINKSIYNIEVNTAYNKDSTDIDKLSNITNMIPNLLININVFNDEESKDDIYVSIYKNNTDHLQKSFANNLNARLNENTNYKVCREIKYDSLYMNRHRYFNTVSININNNVLISLLGLDKEIAKSIFTSIVECFVIPEKGEVIQYVTTANINLKDRPKKGSEYVVTIPKGTVVDLLVKNNNVYWNISATVNDILYTGYAIQMYLKPIKKTNI